MDMLQTILQFTPGNDNEKDKSERTSAGAVRITYSVCNNSRFPIIVLNYISDVKRPRNFFC